MRTKAIQQKKPEIKRTTLEMPMPLYRQVAKRAEQRGLQVATNNRLGLRADIDAAGV